jgi:hypothetical protein
MKSLTINLNPATRGELYSDIHEDFLAFILIEALYNVVKDIPSAMSLYMPVVDDPETYADDPDSNLMASIEFLMEVMKEMDEKTGTDITTPEYLANLPEFVSFVTMKLCLAVETISQFNDMATLMVLGDMLRTPEYTAKLNFSTTHMGNKVMFMLSGLIDL